MSSEMDRLGRPFFLENARSIKVLHMFVESVNGFGNYKQITSMFPSVETSVFLRNQRGRGTLNPRSFSRLFEPLTACRSLQTIEVDMALTLDSANQVILSRQFVQGLLQLPHRAQFPGLRTVRLLFDQGQTSLDVKAFRNFWRFLLCLAPDAPHMRFEVYVCDGTDLEGVRYWAERPYRMLSVEGCSLKAAAQGNVEGMVVDAMQESFERERPRPYIYIGQADGAGFVRTDVSL